MALLCLLAGVASSAVAPPARAAGGQILLDDPFGGATTDAPLIALRGTGVAGVPCLTAGTSASATPLPGCADPALDPPGEGLLRLTRVQPQQVAGIAYDAGIPTAGGLDVRFAQYQYGGTAADGIAFALAAAPPVPTALGGGGGSLGYAPDHAKNADGLRGGYLGIGLDVYGNFTSSLFNGTGCAAQPWMTPIRKPNQITVRGPGHLREGYCPLASTAAQPPSQLSFALRGASRVASRRTVRILIDPDAATFAVGVDPNGGSSYATLVSGALPTSYRDPETGASVNGVPPRISFIFAAATGDQTDIHEIGAVRAATLSGPVPILTMGKRLAGGAPVSGQIVDYVIEVGVDAASPVPETKPQTIRVTDELPPTLTLEADPVAAGWDCAASTARRLDCTSTASADVPPGTALAPLRFGARLAADAPAGATLVNVAEAVSQDAAGPVQARSEATIQPGPPPASASRPPSPVTGPPASSPPSSLGISSVAAAPPALACTNAQLVLIDVLPAGPRVRISGAARPSLAGRAVALVLLDTGKVVARTRVRADGGFSAYAALPPRRLRTSSRTRYQARIGGIRSRALKLARRSYLTSAVLRGATVRLRGRVTGAFRRGTAVTIRQRTTCASEAVVGRARLRRDGSWSATVPAPRPAQRDVAVYRAVTTVLEGSRSRRTFTLAHPAG